MGKWYDEDGAATAFRYVGVLPIILTVIFGALLVYYKSTGGYRAIEMKTAEPSIEALVDGGVGG